ncbi:hypothetical protein JB92DRAFT_3095354 [Gautieria morchelliformis]|nr:hypothetical protein JB92DRAFT_3095354 [Gautieria morchelliformis]
MSAMPLPQWQEASEMASPFVYDYGCVDKGVIWTLNIATGPKTPQDFLDLHRFLRADATGAASCSGGESVGSPRELQERASSSLGSPNSTTPLTTHCGSIAPSQTLIGVPTHATDVASFSGWESVSSPREEARASSSLGEIHAPTVKKRVSKTLRGREMIPCPMCPEVMLRKSVDKHIQSVHERKQEVMCDGCGTNYEEWMFRGEEGNEGPAWVEKNEWKGTAEAEKKDGKGTDSSRQAS